MRRADDVMLHVCADACPAAGVRGRGYAMLPHEVRVPVARDGCDVDFTSSLGGRDDRCAPCTAHGAPAGGRRKSVSSVVRYRLVCRITSNFFFSSVRTTQAQSSDQESDVTLALGRPALVPSPSRFGGVRGDSGFNQEGDWRLRWDAGCTHETITLLGLPCSSSRAPRALRPWRHTSST
jgi:hypothetical protein